MQNRITQIAMTRGPPASWNTVVTNSTDVATHSGNRELANIHNTHGRVGQAANPHNSTKKHMPK